MPTLHRRSFLKRALGVGAAAVLGGRLTFAAQHAGAPLRVGASLPLSGPGLFEEDGLHQLLAYRFWQDEVNAEGGLLGRPVELIVYDDANEVEEAVASYRRLLDEDGVELLLGNYGSGLAGATIEVVEEARMPCVFPMAWQPSLWTQGHRWAAPLLPLASAVTEPLVDYLASEGLERVAIVWANNDYARDLADGLREAVRARGLTPVYEQEYGGMVDVDRALRQAAAEEPDVLAGGNLGEQIPELLDALGGPGVSFPRYAWFELDEPALLPHRDALEGMDGFGLWLPSMPYPGARRFVNDFTLRWEPEYPGKPIARMLDHHSSAGYAAAQVTQRAVEQAGTLEPAAVRDALFALDTTTVFGDFRLDERGVQVGKTVPVIGYRQGLRTTLWPERLTAVGAAAS
ncbi:MAG: amino acid ABC transporter substrate-binding protein [Trueperaceae bacterium]|nr:amino acid ABC transporter substrate-binding protein [Trueperaceae bacterium]